MNRRRPAKSHLQHQSKLEIRQLFLLLFTLLATSVLVSVVTAQPQSGSDGANSQTEAESQSQPETLPGDQNQAERGTDEDKQGVEFYMPDGQLGSHIIRTYLTTNLNEQNNPQLILWGSHLITQKSPQEGQPIEPMLVAPNQSWTQEVAGQQVSRNGTILLFDLSNKLEIPWYKSMMRLAPALTWTDPESGEKVFAISQEEVNLANIVGVVGWALFLVVLMVIVIVWLAREVKGNALYLLTGAAGWLSLSRTQVAGWTIAIGGVVVGYGLIRLEVPDIPDTLIALMGLSLATGGISYARDRRNREVGALAGRKKFRSDDQSPKLSDLLISYDAELDEPRLSIAKAQMLFWTVLLLFLFVTKSILDGILWPVPTEMVALMGLSQAGYLGPKFVRNGTDTPPPESQTRPGLQA